MILQARKIFNILINFIRQCHLALQREYARVVALFSSTKHTLYIAYCHALFWSLEISLTTIS